MIDLNVLGSGNNELPMTISSVPISGVQLLGQRILIILLSSVSEILREQEGSTFINAIGSGVYDTEYTSLLINSAVYKVIDIIDNDHEKYPDDETLRDIKVSDIKYTDGVVTFTLSVTSTAGNTTDIHAGTGDIYG